MARSRSALFRAAATLIGSLWLGADARAATLVVTSTADDWNLGPNGNCTLREAVIAANTDAGIDACPPGNGADTIVLAASTYTLTIPGRGEDAAATGDLDVAQSLTIQGAGRETTIIDGGRLDRVLDVRAAGIALDLSHLTITNGYLGDGTSGAGVFNRGVLDVFDVEITGNDLEGPGGGSGAGLYNDPSGHATLSSSSVRSNSTWTGTAGIDNRGALVVSSSELVDNFVIGPVFAPPKGSPEPEASCSIPQSGGVLNMGSLSLTDSLVKGNLGYTAAVTSLTGIASIVRTRILENVYGPGLDNFGANASCGWTASSMTVTQAVIANGVTYYSPAVANRGHLEVLNSTVGDHHPISSIVSSVSNTGTLVMRHATLTDANAMVVQNAGSVETVNSIVAGSCSIGGTASVHTLGGNLESPGNTCRLTDPTDRVSVSNPMIGPLADNGGPTETQALLAGSPALDAALDSECLPTDQRGLYRVDGACDIGAFESGAIPCTDADGDGFFVEGGGCGLADCADDASGINPGVAEIPGNGLDDDCNPATTDCKDLDGDGYGDPASVECAHAGLDCNDTNANVNPGKTEVPSNGVDDDCNPATPGACTPQLAEASVASGPSPQVVDLSLYLAPGYVLVGLFRRSLRKRIAA